jgi:hypothetical protein
MRTKRPKETVAGLKRQLEYSNAQRDEFLRNANDRCAKLDALLTAQRLEFQGVMLQQTEKHKAELSHAQTRTWQAESAMRNDREFFERVISALAHVPPKPQKDANES